MRLPLRPACAVALLSLSLFPFAHAQGSRADYDRSANLRRIYANKVFRDRIEPHWLPGNTRFWYEVATGPGTREYIFVDAETGARRLAFDHEKLARTLQAAGVKDAEPGKLALSDLDFPSGDILAFTTSGKRWRLALGNYAVLEQKEIPPSTGGLAPADGPQLTSRDGPPNPLRFHNRTRQELEMFWLDHDGQQVSYGRLAPGGSAEQGTYAGHVWLIVEVSTNRPLLVYEAVEGRHDFDITGAVPPLAGLAPAEGPKRTTRDGPPNPLRFTNRTGQEVEMFWLDHDGKRVSYGRLVPGGSAEQRTYAGHVWLIVEVPTKRPLVVVEAVEGRHEFDITGPVESAKLTSGLAFAEGPKRTSRDGPQNPLRFHNRTAQEVEMFWLDHEGKRVSYGRLPPGESAEQGTYAGHVWLIVEVPTNRPLLVVEAVEGQHDFDITGPVESAKPTPPLPRRGRDRRHDSPDGKWSVAIEDHNLVLRDIASGDEFALTTDGTAANAYRDEFAWSPDSKKLAGVRVAPGEEHKVAFVESSPADRVQPVLHTYNYFKPGDKLPHPRPVLWDIPARRQIPIDDALFPNPFTETGEMNLRWTRDSSRFAFRYNQRGHQVLRIIAIDAATGAASAVVDERSRTFITHSSGKAYQQWLDDSNELIWMSERDGWNHLYLYDAATGRVKNQITRGEWVVRSVDYVDAKNRQIWFQAGGLVPGQDPYYIQYCCVNFDGTGLVVLTEGDGTHGCTFSPDRRFVIDRYSRVDAPAVTNLRRTDTGKLVCELERTDATALLRAGWRAPERFVAKARDGETDIYGIILRPSNFDPAKKYPVIEDIYAGPQGSFVPKAFGMQPGMMELAELGFIVVQCDGLGTNDRSKKFHDVCWQNLGDAGLPDRVLWIKAAAAQHPEMDLTRVGIYGTSAGGQSSLGALLTHGDFYKVGVSDCGCHDNRMDKIWWNEQWMGWPIGPHYAAQSNVTLAPNLQGKLLLMVGEMDRNVDPASTMQVVNALIKANKDFDFVMVPGAGHGVAGSPYGKRRLQDFFVRHLLAREPRWTDAATN